MATLETEALAGIFESITRQIVERFHPYKVILFGSYAYGTPNSDSDVDILVILDQVSSPLHTAASISAEIDHPLPLDIVVLGVQQLQEAVDRGAVFATEITKNGKVLYEARNG